MKIALCLVCACVVLGSIGCAKKSPPPVATPPLVAAPASPNASSDTGGSKPAPPMDTGKEAQPDPMEGLKVVASLPDEFYGKWRRTGSSGGMTGGGEKEPSDETIVITKENKIETWTAGKLASTVAFRVGRGKSIFGNDNWLISRGMFNEVIVVRDTDHLEIMENHPDGFNWSYDRVK